MKKLVVLFALMAAIPLVAADKSTWSDGITIQGVGVAYTQNLRHYDNEVGARLAYDVTDRFSVEGQVTGQEADRGSAVDHGSAGVRVGLTKPQKWGQVVVPVGFGMAFPDKQGYGYGGIGYRIGGKHWSIGCDVNYGAPLDGKRFFFGTLAGGLKF